jgi:hypothetical protein
MAPNTGRINQPRAMLSSRATSKTEAVQARGLQRIVRALPKGREAPVGCRAEQFEVPRGRCASGQYAGSILHLPDACPIRVARIFGTLLRSSSRQSSSQGMERHSLAGWHNVGSVARSLTQSGSIGAGSEMRHEGATIARLIPPAGMYVYLAPES